jgi:hypothetical protein
MQGECPVGTHWKEESARSSQISEERKKELQTISIARGAMMRAEIPVSIEMLTSSAKDRFFAPVQSSPPRSRNPAEVRRHES